VSEVPTIELNDGAEIPQLGFGVYQIEPDATAGLVRRTDLGGSRAFYELVREHRHHHAVCERCGAIAHIHDEDLAPLAEALLAATGYRLTAGGEIAVPGVCPACRPAA